MLVLLGACGPPPDVDPNVNLRPGGVFVVHVDHGRDGCLGCDALERGDLIQSVDGVPVHVAADLDHLSDGAAHQLEVWDLRERAMTSVMITAEPNDAMPPLTDAPAFWSVGAEQLAVTPSWARRRLFAHASPQLLLVGVDGNFVNGRDLYGHAHVLVMWDWAASSDRQNAALTMQVLQKAQADLASHGIDILFAQIRHPQQRDVAPMNDSDLRAFFQQNQVGPSEGGPLPPPPMYRTPNKTEDNPTRALGLEGAFTYYEAIGEAPNIFLLDDRGMIRWHSAGPTPDPSGEIPSDMVYTINKAVLFALENL